MTTQLDLLVWIKDQTPEPPALDLLDLVNHGKIDINGSQASTTQARNHAIALLEPIASQLAQSELNPLAIAEALQFHANDFRKRAEASILE